MKKNKIQKKTPRTKIDNNAAFQSDPRPLLRTLDTPDDDCEPQLEYNAAFAVEFKKLTNQEATQERVNKWVNATIKVDVPLLGKYLAAPQSPDDDRFFDLLVKADAGDAKAQSMLGTGYSIGLFGDVDMVEAAKWWRKAAEQNDAKAQFNLGVCYDEGRGVAKDEAEAVKWYRKAAELNFAEAQNNLGIHYEDGQGVSKDCAEAVKWWRKAAEQNLAAAQNNLGCRYVDGRGVRKDDTEAAKWFRKAAEQNLAAAQVNLCLCYARGEGVTRDWVETYKWASLAAEQGDERAQYMVKMMPQDVPADQIAEGKRRATKWRKQHPVWPPVWLR